MLPRRLGFRVPDEDEDDEEDDHDSSSNQSREGSVQVIKSRPRTFSIPSTDDETDSEEEDEVEIASSVQGDGNKDSTLTTPDHGASMKKCNSPNVGTETLGSDLAQREVRGLNLKSPSLQNLVPKPTTLGSSQHEPIDLEGAAGKHDVPDTQSEDDGPSDENGQSEDDGPEVLPIHQPQPITARSPKYVPYSPEAQTISSLLTSAHSPRYRPHSLEVRCSSPQLTSAQSPQYCPHSPQARPASPKFTLAENLQHCRYGPEPRSTSPHFISVKSPLWDEPQLASPQIRSPTVDNTETGLDTQDQLKCLILETQARVSKEKEPVLQSPQLPNAASRVFTEKAPVRELSPEFTAGSIAGATDGIDAEDNDEFDQDDDFSDFNPEKDIDSDEFFPRIRFSQVGSAYPSAPQPHVNMRSVMTGGPPSVPMATTTYSPFPLQNFNHNVSMSEGLDVSQPSRNDHLPSVLRAPSPSDAALAKTDWRYGNLGYEYAGPFCYPELKSPGPASKPYNQGPFSSGNLLPQQPAWADGNTAALPSEPPKISGTDTDSPEIAQRPTCWPEPRKTSDQNCSKLNISSIVNAPLEEKPRSLKRKADEMRLSNEVDEVWSTIATPSSLQAPRQRPPPSPYSASAESREPSLPNAQARDLLPPVEASPLTQESIPEPVIAATSRSITTKAEQSEGPARKKTRTSKSPAGGIGKFVSGVCIGLVGALAAFVATIPASVREEALRELNNDG